MAKIKIGNTTVGENLPTYFIAEIGSNFEQSFDKAKELIKIAKESGADAVKFQNYNAETLVSDHEFKKISNTSHQKYWKNSVFETYKNAELNIKWMSELSSTAKKNNIDFITSPYSYQLSESVKNFVSAYKIGSGDISWIDFIEHLAAKNLPVILATGASDDFEVDLAVNAIRKYSKNLILMQCNTNYSNDDANFDYINLKVLTEFKQKYPSIILGLSDHTQGSETALGAVALGAKVIEKHFTTNTSLPGPDHHFAMTPDNWSKMVGEVRKLERSLGDGKKKIEKNEIESRKVQRRSICLNKDLKSGETIKESDLSYLRPLLDNSFHPYEKLKVINKVLKKNLSVGESIKKENI